MKGYTNLEQSKKLAEILPLKSADMHYFVADSLEKQEINYAIRCGTPIVKTDIPCWSLAALFDIFPNSEQKSVDICHGGWKGEEYVSNWFCSYDNYEKNYFETTNSDNPIDACYEMILKLHEQKLL